jgi:hypothetical protein
VERRKISELIARYRLHPNLKEIYVEGTFDKKLLEWFLRESGRNEVTVYEIDTVDVPLPHERSDGEDGARGRVLSLVRALEVALPARSLCMLGVVDADLDFALGIVRPETSLLVTDYSSMEMYAFTAKCLAKFLFLGLGVSGNNASSFLDIYRDILQEVFLLRLASSTSGLFLSWVDLRDSCAVHRENLTFDREDFLKRLLHKNAATTQREAIEAAVSRHRIKLTGTDARRIMHGHDFTALVAIHWQAAARKQGFRDLSAIPRLLITALDRAELAWNPLFERLLEWSGD